MITMGYVQRKSSLKLCVNAVLFPNTAGLSRSINSTLQPKDTLTLARESESDEATSKTLLAAANEPKQSDSLLGAHKQ